MPTPRKKIILDKEVKARLKQLYCRRNLVYNKGGRYAALYSTDPVKGSVQLQLTRVIMAIILDLQGKRLPMGSWVSFVDPRKPWDKRSTNLKLSTPADGKRRATGNVNADIARRKEALALGLTPDEYLRQLRADYLAGKKGGAQ